MYRSYMQSKVNIKFYYQVFLEYKLPTDCNMRVTTQSAKLTYTERLHANAFPYMGKYRFQSFYIQL